MTTCSIPVMMGYTHTHTYTHVYTHTHSLPIQKLIVDRVSQFQAHTHTYIHAHTYKKTNRRYGQPVSSSHTYIHTHTHTHIQTPTYINTRTRYMFQKYSSAKSLKENIS